MDSSYNFLSNDLPTRGYHVVSGDDARHDVRHDDLRNIRQNSLDDARHESDKMAPRIAVDRYAPLSAGPPGYEPPYAVGMAYDRMGVAYNSMGGAYMNVGTNYESAEVSTPSLPRLGVTMASIHRKRESMTSSISQAVPIAMSSRHYSTNSGQ